MDFRHLGRSGLIVSRLSYGNWLTRGGPGGEEAEHACVHAALDAGITTFDTADVYADTRAEESLGRALKGERREGLEILTKVFAPTGPGRNDLGLSRKHIRESIDLSLRRLGMEYVDVYQAHRYDPATPLEETMEALADVVHSGKAHYIGVCEWSPDQLRRGHALARELRVPLISDQVQYSALWRVPETGVTSVCAELGVGQIAWSPLAQGVLTGKYPPGGGPWPAGSRATAVNDGSELLSCWLNDEVLSRVERLRPLAAEAGLPLARLALAWVLHQPQVSTAVLGASRPAQITENAGAAGVRLDDDLVAAVNAVLDPVVTRTAPEPAGPVDPDWRLA
ncbi:aldo/keto reductase family protein [Streptomyces clavuligerus]|uniref:aldo/keto reductase family protein n=1 Tax=Streptomyces clavuligerus TaxID=1901 RepID=UPI0008107F35|nr:aldo/keto reductase family protein [Streptomyces clavuligerus]ANW17101.1 aldo/keto reductase [Streptomyces clavuligerus]AXU16399.1 aldo/keto reductase [Streptomyces clavuligerus]MBY6301475.1 aldo/keto reductase family protein [Streptomyces clavuligerus]QPL61760.1 aldo/keto reductase family protein [Streptomyces clavuligerus]QPL67793.1 aldo/keto reductase family protein [Streptomyces clavuligerus]